MRIQRPTITQITELKGDGAQLTGSFSGSFNTWEGISGKPDPILSSSAQIADDISGSLSNTAIAALEASIVSGSSQLASDISGSLSTAHVNTKVPGLLSGSAQIASNISGSFISGFLGLTADITANSSDISGLNSYTSSLKTALSLSGTDVTVLGDLTVQGTQTTLNSTAVEIADVNILLASGAANAAAANGAGITVDGASATITYDGSGPDSWDFNKDINTTGAYKINDSTVVDISGGTGYRLGGGSGITADAAAGAITFDGAAGADVHYGDVTTNRIPVKASLGYSDSYVESNGTSVSVLSGGTFTVVNGLSSLDGGIDVNGGAFEVLTNGAVTAGATTVSGLTLGATEITATGTELNLLDGSTAGTVVNSKAVVYGASGEVNATTLQIGGNSLSINVASLTLPAGTTISAYGATLVDDADAATARGTLGLTTTDDVQFNSIGIGTAGSGTTGEIRATGDITAYYSSDERLKENFKTLDGALDKVNQLNGYEFDWKDGIEDVVSKKGHDIGVKAQEVQALYPELVHERDNGYLAVDYVKLTAVLLHAVKELSAKVDELSK